MNRPSFTLSLTTLFVGAGIIIAATVLVQNQEKSAENAGALLVAEREKNEGSRSDISDISDTSGISGTEKQSHSRAAQTPPLRVEPVKTSGDASTPRKSPAAAPTESGASSSSESGLPPLTPALTPEEVFGTLFPPFYISFLETIQSSLIAQGELDAGAAVALESEEAIASFLKTASSILLSENLISNEQYAALEKGMDFVFAAPFERKALEAFALRGLGAPQAPDRDKILTSRADRQSFLERTNIVESLGADAVYSIPAFREFGAQASCALPNHAGRGGRDTGRALWRPVLEITQILATVFPLPQEASAFCGPTYCINTPECYLPGPILPGGANLPVVPCCFGRTCGAPTGCFELCGEGSRPFIYDPTTAICGCG